MRRWLDGLLALMARAVLRIFWVVPAANARLVLNALTVIM